LAADLNKNQSEDSTAVNQKKLFFNFDSVTGEKNIARIMQNQQYFIYQ
jgi:hypothetical protein